MPRNEDKQRCGALTATGVQCSSWARQAVEDYLAALPSNATWGDFARGVGECVRQRRARGAKTGVGWGCVAGGEERRPWRRNVGTGGVGKWTIRALRDIGVLDEVMEVENGLVVYPNAVLKRLVTYSLDKYIRVVELEMLEHGTAVDVS